MSDSELVPPTNPNQSSEEKKGFFSKLFGKKKKNVPEDPIISNLEDHRDADSFIEADRDQPLKAAEPLVDGRQDITAPPAFDEVADDTDEMIRQLESKQKKPLSEHLNEDKLHKLSSFNETSELQKEDQKIKELKEKVEEKIESEIETLPEPDAQGLPEERKELEPMPDEPSANVDESIPFDELEEEKKEEQATSKEITKEKQSVSETDEKDLGEFEPYEPAEEKPVKKEKTEVKIDEKEFYVKEPPREIPDAQSKDSIKWHEIDEIPAGSQAAVQKLTWADDEPPEITIPTETLEPEVEAIPAPKQDEHKEELPDVIMSGTMKKKDGKLDVQVKKKIVVEKALPKEVRRTDKKTKEKKEIILPELDQKVEDTQLTKTELKQAYTLEDPQIKKFLDTLTAEQDALKQELMQVINDPAKGLPKSIQDASKLQDQLDRLEIPKPARVVDNEAFVTKDGARFHDLAELLAGLDKMNSEVFVHHALQGRNDFADWTDKVLKEKKLANSLRKCRTKEESSTAVKKAIAVLDLKITDVKQKRTELQKKIRDLKGRQPVNIDFAYFFKLHKATNVNQILKLIEMLEYLYQAKFKDIKAKNETQFRKWIQDFLDAQKKAEDLRNGQLKQELVRLLEEHNKLINDELVSKQNELEELHQNKIKEIGDLRVKELELKKTIDAVTTTNQLLKKELEIERDRLHNEYERRFKEVDNEILKKKDEIDKAYKKKFSELEDMELKLKDAEEELEHDRLHFKNDSAKLIEDKLEIERDKKDFDQIRKGFHDERKRVQDERDQETAEHKRKLDEIDAKVLEAHKKIDELTAEFEKKTKDLEDEFRQKREQLDNNLKAEDQRVHEQLNVERNNFEEYKRTEDERIANLKKDINEEKEKLESLKNELRQKEDHVRQIIDEHKNHIRQKLDEVKQIDENLTKTEDSIVHQRESLEKEGFQKYLKARLNSIGTVGEEESPDKHDDELDKSQNAEFYDRITECHKAINEARLNDAKRLYNDLKNLYHERSKQLEEKVRNHIYNSIRELYDDIKLASLNS